MGYLAILLSAFVTFLSACGGDGTGPGTDESVASVVVTPAASTLFTLGQRVQLGATARNSAGGTIAGKVFTWSSSNASVAAVDASGLVTAVANGTATITASTDGVDGTAAVMVEQVATSLAFTVTPSNATAGEPFTVQVGMRDATHNIATNAGGSVTLAIGANPSGGALSGATTVNASAGLADFEGLSIDRSGDGYTLVATAAGLQGTESSPMDIVHGEAAGIAFALQPSSGTVGVAISPPVRVELRDQLGNIVTATVGSVSVRIGTNPGGAVLSGTTTRFLQDGAATFDDLSLSSAGVGYTLVASFGSLPEVASAPFDMVASLQAGAPCLADRLACGR